MVVDPRGLDLNLRPGWRPDQETYMKLSPVVLWRELKEVGAPAEAPQISGEEEKRRAAGQGVKAGGVAECGATPDTAGPGLPFHWCQVAPLIYCSRELLRGAPGMRPVAESASSAATLIRRGIPQSRHRQTLHFHSHPPPIRGSQ